MFTNEHEPPLVRHTCISRLYRARSATRRRRASLSFPTASRWSNLISRDIVRSRFTNFVHIHLCFLISSASSSDVSLRVSARRARVSTFASRRAASRCLPRHPSSPASLDVSRFARRPRPRHRTDRARASSAYACARVDVRETRARRSTDDANPVEFSAALGAPWTRITPIRTRRRP